MKKVMTILLGAFFLAGSMSALEVDNSNKEFRYIAKIKEDYAIIKDSISEKAKLESELEKALTNAIKDNTAVAIAADKFKTKKEFLETSKRILEKWVNEIDSDLKALK